MASAFYNRFSNNTDTEAFSTDAVFTQFSTSDPDYVETTDATCDVNPSSGCTDSSNQAQELNCKCLFKENVNKLALLKDSKDRSSKGLEDGNEINSAKAMDSINLGIGISIMLASIYYMNQ